MNIDVFICSNNVAQHLMFAPFVSLIDIGDYVIGAEDGEIYRVLHKCTIQELSDEMSMIVLLAGEEPERVAMHMSPEKVDWNKYEKGDEKF